jgi:hypothetical protein
MEPSSITEPLHILSFLIIDFRLSLSLLRFFSFTRWNSGYHGAFHELFLSPVGILAITELLTKFFFHTLEFLLLRSLSRIFSFTRCDSGHHGAFHEFFLSHVAILAITEPFTIFFFHTLEFWLSRSLSRIFQRVELMRHLIWGKLFSYISQRVFT